jgi:diguanylate cyclase (GGDEF)-like protein
MQNAPMADPTHNNFLRWLKFAFAFELVLVALVTGMAILSLRTLRAEVQGIVEMQNTRLARIHEMRSTVRERMLRVNMLLTELDPFRRDEYRQAIYALGERFMKVRGEVEAAAQDDAERAALAAARAANRETALVVERILELEEAGAVEEARRLLLTQAVPRQEVVLARTEGLLELYRQRTAEAIARARAFYGRTLLALGGLGLAAMVLTIVTGAVVVQRSRRDRQQLLDEMAGHAETAARLQKLSHTLEEEVAERTRELKHTADLLREAQRIGRMAHWEWEVESGRFTAAEEIHSLFGLDGGKGMLTYDDFIARVHPDDRRRFHQMVTQALALGEPYRFTHRIVLPDGSVRHMLEQGVAERDATGRVLRLVGTVQDVTETENLQRELWQLAHRDPLTGLPNRLLLMDRLAQAVALGRRDGREFALVLFDLDGFKAVNDHCGHQVGDALLVEVARRVRQVLREGDTLCRYGGDEFVGIFPGVGPGSEIEAMVARIESCFAEPLALDCRVARVRASIGLAFFPADGVNADDLLRCADADMYRAKRGGSPRLAAHGV